MYFLELQTRGLTAVILTLGTDRRLLGHIIEIHLKVAPMSMQTKTKMNPVDFFLENDPRLEIFVVLGTKMAKNVRLIFYSPLKVALMSM